jgi:hypothetical protein
MMDNGAIIATQGETQAKKRTANQYTGSTWTAAEVAALQPYLRTLLPTTIAEKLVPGRTARSVKSKLALLRAAAGVGQRQERRGQSGADGEPVADGEERARWRAARKSNRLFLEALRNAGFGDRIAA